MRLAKCLGLAAALLGTWIGGAWASDSGAPFGLTWGMSTKEATDMGVKLQSAKSEDGTSTFSAQGLPRVLGDVESVRLDFGYDDRLRKVVAASRSFPNDPYGTAVLARYAELLDVLRSKYGNGRSTHKLGDSIYAEQKHFLYGLRSGRSWYYTNFETPEVAIELSIRASDGDTGYWVLIYDNLSLAKDVEKQKREREKKSL